MANKEVDLQDRSKMDYENIQNIQFYAASTIRRIFFIFGCFASLGVLKLISHWIKTLFIILNYNKVPIKHRIDYKAVKAIIKDAYGQIIICDHTIRNIQGKQVGIIIYKNIFYIYNESNNKISPFIFETKRPFAYYIQSQDGLKQDDVQQIADHNGENSIEIPVPPLFSIIIDEGLNPFIFFQLFSITVWLCIDYYIYASVIAIITTISVFLSVYQTRRNLIDLHDKTLTEAKLVTVFRRGGDNQSNKININTKELLPGDVYEVNDGDIMPCDSLLLSGNCVVDESMLTGESNAVIKTEIPHIINSQKSEQSDDELTDNQNQQNNELLDIDHHKQYILFGGTHVIRSRNISTETGDNTSSRAFVLRTGFSTAKGQLVRSILFPKPTTFKFYEDSFKFVGVMGILAVIGFIITGIAQYHYGASWFDIFFRAADLVTIAVPPQLPVVISSAQGYSIRRLKMKNIFCIAPQRINFAGKVKVVCFDKTGTLTEDGLGVKGVHPIRRNIEKGNRVEQINILQLNNENSSLNEQTIDIIHQSKQQSLSYQFIDLNLSTTPYQFPNSGTPYQNEKTSAVQDQNNSLNYSPENNQDLIPQNKSPFKSLQLLYSSNTDYTFTSFRDSYSDVDNKFLLYDEINKDIENLNISNEQQNLKNQIQKQKSENIKILNTPLNDQQIQQHLYFGLAACHSIANLNDNLVGDPLDIQMFQFTDFQLLERKTENNNRNEQLTIQEDENKKIRLENNNNNQMKQFMGDSPYSKYIQTIAVSSRNTQNSLNQDNNEYFDQINDKSNPEDDNNQQSLYQPYELIPYSQKHSIFQNETNFLQDQQSTQSQLKDNQYQRIQNTKNNILSKKEINNPVALGFVKRFDFVQSLQRQTVIIHKTTVANPIHEMHTSNQQPSSISNQDNSNHFYQSSFASSYQSQTHDLLSDISYKSTQYLDVYTKGAPEVIKQLCVPETIPSEYDQILQNYTKQGLRIIAFAHKQIPLLPYETIDNIQRNECESELQFLGFLILINKLRPASKEVIKRLTDANVQCMMVTGDNILTAVNTARNCGIIPVPANQNLIDGVSSVNQKQNTQQNYHNQDDINMDNYQQLENEQISNSETRSADFDFERQYPVFLGDIDTDGEVEWRCDIYPEWILDPVTLFPKYSPIGLKQQQCNNLIQNTNTIEVYNPFKSWKGGPWGILHFRGGFKLPERFYPNFSLNELNQDDYISNNLNNNMNESGLNNKRNQKQKKDIFKYQQFPLSGYFLAITGPAFRRMHNQAHSIERNNDTQHNTQIELNLYHFRKICFLTCVFARMQPDDKAHLIETLIDLGLIVGMCGDGANDCGALKAAHVGLSLSTAEASVASPFTANIPDIKAMEQLLIEGRGTLSSSFHAFKATAIFTLTQFISTAILIELYSMLSDFSFLIIDMFITLPLLFTIGYISPSKRLTNKTPQDSLLSFPVISSIFMHLIVSFVVQIIGLFVIKGCSDFIPLDKNDTDFQNHIESFEMFAIFFSSLISYTSGSVVLNLFDSHLQPFFKNTLFIVSLTFTSLLTLFIYIEDVPWINHLVQLRRTIDMRFYVYLAIASASTFIITVLLEYGFCQLNMPKKIRKCLGPQQGKYLRFKNVKKERKYERVVESNDNQQNSFITNENLPLLVDKQGGKVTSSYKLGNSSTISKSKIQKKKIWRKLYYSYIDEMRRVGTEYSFS